MKFKFLFYLVCAVFIAFDASAQVSKGVIASKVRSAENYTSMEQLPDLVAQITKGLKSNEAKAYAIYAWIAQFIGYDKYKQGEIDKQYKGNRNKVAELPQQDILTSRAGVCEEIAVLFAKMCTEAKVPARVITGCLASSKNSKECRESPHAWNAVWINGKWELVDVTNALNSMVMTDISSLGRYERELNKQIKPTGSMKKKFGAKTHSFNEDYFMINPNKMRRDHHPKDERWYLTNSTDRKDAKM